MTLYEDLLYRGLIKDISSEELKEKLNNEKLTFYIGTDPTGDSMHIGHYSSFLISKRLKQHGHNPILLIGGATGMIGDPKPTAERAMITKEEVEHNFNCLKKQAEDIFGFEVVNNADWIKDINVIDFLRDYGKYFNINYMLNKDIVSRRLNDGITYAEFSYMILQALDFLHLYETRNCTLQVAGQDQWGNITAGIELIRKKIGKEAYSFTMPLITKSDGTKFGKSEGNAIWLDKNKTSSYEMYQFLINSEDEKVIEYLKYLTFLTKEEIEEIEKQQTEQPHLRIAQQRLAEAVITDLHGMEEYKKALKISQCLFSGNIKDLKVDEIMLGLKDIPNFKLELDITLIDLIVNNKIVTSRREAREFINNNALSLNGDIVNDENLLITKDLLIENKVLIIRKGKKKYYMGIV